MKSKLTLIAILVFSINLNYGCKTRKEAEKVKTSIDSAAKVDSSAKQIIIQQAQIQSQETDKTGTWIDEVVYRKVGKDTVEIRRIKTHIRADVKKAEVSESKSHQRTEVKKSQAVEVKAKRMEHKVDVVRYNIPFWVYFVCGLAIAGVILYIVKLKFL